MSAYDHTIAESTTRRVVDLLDNLDVDDPYIICHWCDEMQDALTGRVIQPGRSKR